MPTSMELAVVKRSARCGKHNSGLADEHRQPARGGAGYRRGVGGRHAQRVAEVVEGSAPRDQRFLERGECLGQIDGNGSSSSRTRGTEAAPVATRAGRHGAARSANQAGGAAAHFARIEQRAQALCTTGCRGAVPAEPALCSQVGQARRVAIDLRDAHGARARPSLKPRSAWWQLAQALASRATGDCR